MWLDEQQQDAWRKLVTVVERLPGVLDTQLRHDSDLSHFDYMTLAMVSEAPGRTLRMTQLAERTNSTLPRLSHVVSRLEDRGFVERSPCPDDGRAINARLTQQGWEKVAATAPGHAAAVLGAVFAELDAQDVEALDRVMMKVLSTLSPDPSPSVMTSNT